MKASHSASIFVGLPNRRALKIVEEDLIYGGYTVTAEPTLLGDANCDDVVNDDDASIVGAHWMQASGARWGDGDFNFDGKVNDDDAAILAAHWGESLGEASVPEPGSFALLAGIALMGMIYFRRRRAQRVPE